MKKLSDRIVRMAGLLPPDNSQVRLPRTEQESLTLLRDRSPVEYQQCGGGRRILRKRIGHN